MKWCRHIKVMERVDTEAMIVIMDINVKVKRMRYEDPRRSGLMEWRVMVTDLSDG